MWIYTFVERSSILNPLESFDSVILCRKMRRISNHVERYLTSWLGTNCEAVTWTLTGPVAWDVYECMSYVWTCVARHQLLHNLLKGVRCECECVCEWVHVRVLLHRCVCVHVHMYKEKMNLCVCVCLHFVHVYLCACVCMFACCSCVFAWMCVCVMKKRKE